MGKQVPHPKQSRSSKVGFMMASYAAPRSFQKSLMDRDSLDQGIVTGLTMGIAYALGAITQDGLELIADQISANGDGKSEDEETRQDKISLALSAGAIAGGIALQYYFRQRDDESMLNASTRTGGHILARVGLAGLVSQVLEKFARQINKDKSRAQSEIVYSLIVPTGMALSVLLDKAVHRGEEKIKEKNDQSIDTKKSIGISLGILAFLGGLSFVERKTAKSVDSFFNKNFPYLNRSWLPLGHIMSLGVLVGGIGFGIKGLYGRIENGADKFEDYFKKKPTSPLVSGSKDSLVKWSTLSVQGRRHIGTVVPKKEIADVLNVDISEAKDPIRIYVGLDSADSEPERVQIALKELKRTGAFSRKNIVVISPTGTGYVNYVMSDALEYMSKGDCAQVTIQYSKRPSPLSLDRRDEGHIQYRMLINAIKKELLKISPKNRPKLMLFGESLGAWTSQDAFMYEGTDGLEASLVSRALWIGTPSQSKWKETVLSGNTLNTETEQIGVFNHYDEFQALSPKKRSQVRYFMVTHYNDPVARFTTNLLVQAPDWLQDDKKRPPTIPRSTRFRVPGTFVQTLVDMKNALKPIPGKFVASGHDYRGDLAPFVRTAFDLSDISEPQFKRVHQALVANDKKRGKKKL
jgi:uncharacterized membrane protein